MCIGCEKLSTAIFDQTKPLYLTNQNSLYFCVNQWLYMYVVKTTLAWYSSLQLLPSYIWSLDKILGIQEKQGENTKPSDQIFLLWYREIILMIVCNILETTSTMVNDQPTMKIRILRKKFKYCLRFVSFEYLL